MKSGKPQAGKPLRAQARKKLRASALSVFEKWDHAWPGIQAEIESAGKKILCRPGCVPCCYRRVFCTLAESVAIADHIRRHFPPEQQEHFRLRVEATASSLQKLRADGFCESEDLFYRAGGLECPFLEEGRCSIYAARPLDCRALNATTDVNTEDCRKCPQAVNCIESEAKRFRLQKELGAQETAIGVPPLRLSNPRPLLADVLSYLWQTAPPATVHFSAQAWKERLASRSTERDDTWQDDRSDFRAIRMPIRLPAEGDYPPDLTLVRQRQDVHELYGRPVMGEGIPAFCTLYKRHPGCRFDWTARRFRASEPAESRVPYTVWMSDDLQERLMMWEAAKRARGRVLCGGLGLGVFPQFALALPRVEAVDIIEKDPDIIALIQSTWDKQPWPRRSACAITEIGIEDYLQTTTEQYDTVYIDTWDALYHEYLPHLNELTQLARRVLRPQGEILLWGYDRMVRDFLRTVSLLTERRGKYLAAGPAQLENIARLYPLLHRLVGWLKQHPDCSNQKLQTEAYRIATRERRNLGILVLSRQPGAQQLLEQKYFRAAQLQSSPATAALPSS